MYLPARITHLSLLALALASTAVPCANAVVIDLVTVGNPGNAGEPATAGQLGAVDHVYQIGKYDVTIAQYTAFLNAKAATDTYSLYNPSMATDLNIAGIQREGSDGTFTYSVIGNSGNKPITYVSWFDAARFANWMHNGQGAGSTETGAYTLSGGATIGAAAAVNPGARFYIPTNNEWYKAAYYSPTLNSGAGGFYAYATQSNTDLGNVVGGGANQANYRDDTRGDIFSVTQSSDHSPSQNYLTDVGAFTNSASYYGTFDQSGNVFQWNDLDGGAGAIRVYRGGYWYYNAFGASSTPFYVTDPSFEFNGLGFRLASPSAVPEIDPAGIGSVLVLVGGAVSLIERRRRRSV